MASVCIWGGGSIKLASNGITDKSWVQEEDHYFEGETVNLFLNLSSQCITYGDKNKQNYFCKHYPSWSSD
jgi:hypothetical protein